MSKKKKSLYGKIALEAVGFYLQNQIAGPRMAWDKASYLNYPDKKFAREKGCPRDAFLGLCEEGYVAGVPSGKYTKSKLNKDYAINILAVLERDSSLEISELWNLVETHRPHNGQALVVKALFEARLLRTLSVSNPFRADGLRPPEYIHTPDPRARSFVITNYDTGVQRPITLYDQHEFIAQYSLVKTVPKHIQVSFDTARNLYLYSWLVYRFYNVAEQQVLSTLELALRTYLEKFFPLPEDYWPKHRKGEPSLRPMLRYCIDQRLLKNEGFTVWKRRGYIRAKERYKFSRIKEMKEKGLDSIEMDYSNVEVTEEDIRDFDYLSVVLDVVVNNRNQYSHGSTSLDPNVLRSFEVVSEVVNQLYTPNE